MRIQVGGLSDGIHQYRFQVDPAELSLDGNFAEDVIVEVSLDKTGNRFLLRSTIQASGTFECDRCVAQFARTLQSSYQMYYVPEGDDQGENDPAEIQVIPSGLTVIDISDDVRQTIQLSIPLKLLCQDDCEGLCPHCGTNLNNEQCSCTATSIDPRWEKLAGLQRKNLNDRS